MAQHATAGVYTLRATISKDTVVFTERPNRRASNISTNKFVESFKDLFASSMPNAAITFADDDPLIVVLSQPKIVKKTTTSLMTEEDESTTDFVIGYVMEQSESQGAVVSIKQFLDTSGSCSIFIVARLEYRDGVDVM